MRLVTLDERLAPVGKAAMDALVEIASAGHLMKVQLEPTRSIDLNNGFTTPDDVLRFRKFFPALDSFAMRISIPDATNEPHARE